MNLRFFCKTFLNLLDKTLFKKLKNQSSLCFDFVDTFKFVIVHFPDSFMEFFLKKGNFFIKSQNPFEFNISLVTNILSDCIKNHLHFFILFLDPRKFFLILITKILPQKLKQSLCILRKILFSFGKLLKNEFHKTFLKEVHYSICFHLNLNFLLDALLEELHNLVCFFFILQYLLLPKFNLLENVLDDEVQNLTSLGVIIKKIVIAINRWHVHL